MTVISDVMAFWGPHFRDVLVRVVVQQLARQPRAHHHQHHRPADQEHRFPISDHLQVQI